MTEHRLSIPGVIEQVPHACNWVVRIAEDIGLDVRDINHCELAIDEAVTNIIEHGYGAEGADKVIDIVLNEQPDRITITIMDDGPPFDPLGRDDPDPLSALEERPSHGGGWGVFFIKRLMDDVGYKYSSNRNHLMMVKERNE